MYALAPDFSAWSQRLLHDEQADCQMPLAMLCSWLGGKILGTQEWQLRAVNLIWGALALVALHRIGRKLQLPWLPLLLAIQPYFWFYLNEARPYALQLAAGAWLLCALVELITSQAAGCRWAWQLMLAAFFLFSATMLAPLPVLMVALVGGTMAWRQGWRAERKAWLILIGGFLACVPLAIYYATTLLRGVTSAQVWQVDFKFVLYVFYELTGMGGIGISPLEIRSLARSPQLAHEIAIRFPQLILPLLLGALLAVVIFLGLRKQWRTHHRTTVASLLSVFALSSLVLVAVSLILQKAFWARHYASLFPFYVTLLGLAFAGVGSRRWLRWLPPLIGLLLIYSALHFRFAASLRKEDFRAASALARTALEKSQSVWWVAGDYSAMYYGLKVSHDRPEPGVVFAPWLSPTDPTSLPLPQVIVVSKPDVFDAGGAVQKIISENNYILARRFQGFTIWTNAAK